MNKMKFSEVDFKTGNSNSSLKIGKIKYLEWKIFIMKKVKFIKEIHLL